MSSQLQLRYHIILADRESFVSGNGCCLSHTSKSLTVYRLVLAFLSSPFVVVVG